MYVKHPNRWLILILCASAIASALWAMTTTPARAQAPTPAAAPVRVLQSDTSRVVLEFSAPTYTAQPRNIGGANYLALTIPGLGNTSEPGKPQLPMHGAMIGVPPGAVVAFKIIEDDATRVKLSAPPLPAPTARAEYDLARTSPRSVHYDIVPDVATYAANQFYPADAARIGTDGTWRSQRYLSVQFYPLQYNGATRELVFHRRLRVEITFTYPRGQTREALGGTVNEGVFEATLKTMLLNYDSAKSWRAKTAAPGVSAPKSTRSGTWFRIAVNSDGMYKITCAQLQALGATPDPNTIKIYKQNTELALYQAWSSGDPCDNERYIAFWGQGLDTKYTDTNAYWLTYGGANGKRMTTRDGSGSGTAATAYTHTVHLEDNVWFLPNYPKPVVENESRWYWSWLYSSSQDYTFTVSNLATSAYSATLGYVFIGWMDGVHQTTLSINGNSVATLNWSGQGRLAGTATFPVTWLISGTNTLRATEAYARQVVIDSFDVAFTRAFVAITDTLRFRQPNAGAWQYTISGFSTNAILGFDITDPFNVVHITSPNIFPSGSYSYQFADNQSSAREYIVLATTQFKTPASIVQDTPSDLKNTSNGADYIIIAHDSFVSAIQPLAAFRQSQGLRVKVVAVQDVYDEFNDGVLDPQAIRDFLAYAYSNWTPPAPAMVLLVGDAHFDPRGYCVTVGKCPQDGGLNTSPNTIFIPAPLRIVDAHRYESADDNFYVAFNDGTGNMMPQMALGRLPVNSVAEVNDVVTKLLAYEQSTPTGTWRSRVAFVSDNAYDADGNADGGGNFWAYSDAIAANPYYLPSGYQANRVYYNPCDPNAYPQCALPYPSYATTETLRSALLTAINQGSVIVNYVGHGSTTQWAGEGFFKVADVDTLTNGYKLPFFVDMTCDTGYYIHPKVTIPGLGEKNVRRAGNGALAVWAATGWGFADDHDFLNRGLFEAIFHNGERRLGPATVAGKAFFWAANQPAGDRQREVLKMFVLLGDPASRLQLQTATYLPLILKAQ
jgi:hypothetical protein